MVPEKDSRLLAGLIPVVKHLLRDENIQEKAIFRLSLTRTWSRGTLRCSCKLCLGCCQVERSRIPFDECGRKQIADRAPCWVRLRAYDRGVTAVRYSCVAASGWNWCLEAELANWWLGEADVGEIVYLASLLFALVWISSSDSETHVEGDGLVDFIA